MSLRANYEGPETMCFGTQPESWESESVMTFVKWPKLMSSARFPNKITIIHR